MPDDTERKGIGAAVRALVLLLFFASGFAALVYEIVWARLLHRVLGSTVFAVSAVLAAFMGGMAVGAAVIGRRVDKRRDPLHVYVLLELGVLACVIAIPHVLRYPFGPLYGVLFRALGPGHWLLLPVRFVVGAIIVAIPAALMGGTLPAMARFLARPGRHIGITVSALYTVNTLGAVAGSFMAGFVLLPAMGLANTTRLAAAVTLAVAAVALVLWQATRQRRPIAEEHLDEKTPSETPPTPLLPPPQQRLVLVLFALSGFTALAYEVTWTRLLIFFGQNSTYAFSMMLTVYLLGITIGSALHNALIRGTHHPARWFFRLELLLALAVAYGLLVAPAARDVSPRLGAAPFAAGAITAFVRTALVMLAPTILLGLIFPVATALIAGRPDRTATGVGRAYFANTIGAVLGALAAAFLLIPAFGIRTSLIVLACVNAFIALALIVPRGALALEPARKRGAAVVWLVVTAVLFVVPVWRSGGSFRSLFLADPSAKLAYINEGVGGTVTIEQFPSYKTISIDGTNVAGTNLAFETTQKLQAHLALLIHRDPKDVLQIGFGSGGTAYSASLHPVERIDCVELVPAIIAAAPEFEETNHGVLNDPRVHLYIEDARAYVRHTRRQYDVILSDSTHPVFAGNGALYTMDYFRDCARRLKPGGVFSTWLPVHNLRFEDYAVILRSLRTAFPYVYVWHTAVGRNQWTIVNAFQGPVDPRSPLMLSYSRLVRRMSEPRLAADLATIHFTDPVDLMGLYLLGPREVDALVKATTRLNTDDNATIEFIAARAASSSPRMALFLEAYPKLLSLRPAGAVFFDLRDLGEQRGGEVVRQLAHRWWSSNRVLRGRLIELAGQVHRARAEWHRALDEDPANEVARDLLGMTKRDLADAKGLTPPAASCVEIGLYHLAHADEAAIPHERTAQLEDAAAAFEAALEHDARYTAAYDNLARTYFKLGRLDAAIDVTVQLRKDAGSPATYAYVPMFRRLVYAQRDALAFPDDDANQRTLAELALGMQMDDLAATTLSSVPEPESPDERRQIERLLTRVEISRGNFNEAAEHAQKLEDEELANKIGYWREFPIRAIVEQFHLGQESGTSPEHSTTRAEERARKHFARAKQLLEDLDYTGARRELKRSVRADDGFLPGWLALAYVGEFTGNYDDGLDALKALDAAAPTARQQLPEITQLEWRLRAMRLLAEAGPNPSVSQLHKAALAYIESKLYEEALECLRRAEQLDPKDIITLLNIAGCYRMTRQTGKAKEYYEKVLAVDPDNENAKRLLESLQTKTEPSPEDGASNGDSASSPQ